MKLLKTVSLKISAITLIAGWSTYRVVVDSVIGSEAISFQALVKAVLLIWLIVISTKPRSVENSFAAWLGIILSFGSIALYRPLYAQTGQGVGLVQNATVLFYVLILSVSYVFLNRSFGITPALREVKTSGPYQLVRHPIYASTAHMFASLVVVSLSLTNLIALVAHVFGLWLRVISEESVLGKDVGYRSYSSQVKFRIASPLFSLPLLILAATAFLYRTSSVKVEAIRIHASYPVFSLDPTIYDDWTSVFVSNHILARLTRDQNRPELEFVAKEVNLECSKREKSSCQIQKLQLKLREIKTCDGDLLTAAQIKNEFAEIIKARSWLFPGWQHCETTASEICISGPTLSDIPQRMDSVYFRFGWSGALTHSKSGIGPYCLDIVSQNAGLIEEAVLTAKDEEKLPILMIGSKFREFDLSIFGAEGKSATYQKVETQTPLGYFVVSNPAKDRQWAWNSQETRTILRRHLLSAGLLVEVPNFGKMIPVGQAFVKTNSLLKSEGSLLIPDYFPRCEELRRQLEAAWKRSGANQTAVCGDLMQFLNGPHKFRNNNWDGFISPVSAGFASPSAIQDQYFSQNSKDSFTGSSPTPEKYYYLVGVGSAPISVKKDRFCGLRPSPLGMSDLFITDLNGC